MPKYKKIEQEMVDKARDFHLDHSPKPVKERLDADDLEVLDFYHDSGLVNSELKHEIMWGIWKKNGREAETKEERLIRLEAERLATIELNEKKKKQAELDAIEAQKQDFLKREAAKEERISAELAAAEARVKKEKARLAAIAARKQQILEEAEKEAKIKSAPMSEPIAAEELQELAETVEEIVKPEPPKSEEKTVDEVIDELQ